jgi:uncharacterized protein YkwD
MGRNLPVLLACLAISGCASVSMPSVSTIGGANEPDPPKPEKSAQAPATPESSGTLGGIWKNFSSVFSSGAQPAAQKPTDGPPPVPLDANEALRLINGFRATKGLAPVSIDPLAMTAAETLAKDMAREDRIFTNARDLGTRLLAAGYSYRVAAENVSGGQASVAETIEGWKKSPQNSRNMLLPTVKHIGIGYEYKSGTKYKTFWTLIVAAP